MLVCHVIVLKVQNPRVLYDTVYALAEGKTSHGQFTGTSLIHKVQIQMALHNSDQLKLMFVFKCQ